MGRAEGELLEHALDRILPGGDETRLLRAILHRGPSAREAWNLFGEGLPNLPSLFRTDTGNRKRLSPLLLDSIRENNLDADPTLLTILKTATLREGLRVAIVRDIAAEVYAALRGLGLPFLVVKGAALGETAYADPVLRHAHDIDLLVEPSTLDRATEALIRLGFEEGPALPWGQGRSLGHATGLPVLLLERPYRIPFYRGRFGDLSRRARTLSCDPLGTIRILDPTDALLHCLGHASYCPGRSNLLWVVDAWMILAGTPPVDWDAFEQRAREMRLEVPLAPMLGYLSDEIGAPVPPKVVDRSRAGLDSADHLGRDVALFGARQTLGRPAELEGRPQLGWRGRLTLLRWELLPSRDYLEWAYDRPHRLAVPAIYLTRPFSALAERARWKLLRALRRRR